MSHKYSTVSNSSVTLQGELKPGYEDILTKDALDFLKLLHLNFNSKRLELLKSRAERQKRIDEGENPQFLGSTQHIREASWKIDPLPSDLATRRVEITGPPEVKMVINALNSGADAYMVDFEDSNSPTWDNLIQGQINVKAAVRRNLHFKAETGKEYRLNENLATLSMRPRGWHLDEKNILINGERTSGSLFDFGLFFFHNAKEQINRGTGPYFYLPKLQSHLEARLWNDVFIFSQKQMGIPVGTIKATVLIETLLAAFEMDEILYELRQHSAGLNAGRWDYIFSCIKTFRNDSNFALADRSLITMTSPFMRAYCLYLIRTCHRRNAPAIGGMSALIPIRNDPAANERALAGVREDKARDASDGFDGGWVAHPGLVELAKEEFEKVLKGRPNQIEKKLDDIVIYSTDLLNFQPNKPITLEGLKMNIRVGIRYLSSWLAGNGCVPIFNLMEDAATAEISRSQVWQWIKSNSKLDDGDQITVELVRQLIKEELNQLQKERPNNAFDGKAANIFDQLSTSGELTEFLTLPLYENL